MAEIFSACPGASRFKTPTITEKTCPVCGSTIELFSTDAQAQCENCGFTAYNDTLSCVRWCKYAKLCVGPDTYSRMMELCEK